MAENGRIQNDEVKKGLREACHRARSWVLDKDQDKKCAAIVY